MGYLIIGVPTAVKVAFESGIEMHTFEPPVRRAWMVTVVVWPAPTPLVAFMTSFRTTGDAPTALVWVKVVVPVVVLPLFHLIVPVLGVGLLFDESDLISVVQFDAFKIDVEALVPLVIPATPEQPENLAESLTVEFTFLEAVGPEIGGKPGLHVSVPVSDLQFGTPVTAPAGAAISIIDSNDAKAANTPKDLRIFNAPSSASYENAWCYVSPRMTSPGAMNFGMRARRVPWPNDVNT